MKKIKIPRVDRHYQSIDEFKEYASRYFTIRNNICAYTPSEMRGHLGLTPDQLGIITNIYNKVSGDFEKCIALVDKRHITLKPAQKTKLKEVPYLKYEDYLKSDYWQRHRKIILAKNKKCVLCNRKASHIHHRSYKHRGTEKELADLTPLCTFCHELFHETHTYNSREHRFYDKSPF